MLWPSLWAGTLLFVAWGIVPKAALFTSVLPPTRLVGVASVLKLALLASAAVWSLRAGRELDAANPVRPAWILLGAGMSCNLLGQAVLARYQLFGGQTPFPSVADVFYVLAYPLIGLALLRFVRVYEEAGYPVGSPAERTSLVAGATVACALLSVIVLRPVVLADTPALDKVLGAAYPLLDMALLVPLSLLLRTTWRMRGGSVGTAWLLVLSGIVFLCAGDVLFAYFSALGKTGLDPFVHAAFVVSYGLIAAGVRRHLALVTA